MTTASHSIKRVKHTEDEYNIVEGSGIHVHTYSQMFLFTARSNLWHKCLPLFEQ